MHISEGRYTSWAKKGRECNGLRRLSFVFLFCILSFFSTSLLLLDGEFGYRFLRFVGGLPSCVYFALKLFMHFHSCQNRMFVTEA